MKKPAGEVRNSCVSVGTSQTVKTAMSWHVWVPVGSSSRMTSFGAEGVVRIDWICALLSDLFSGGSEDRVSFKGRGL